MTDHRNPGDLETGDPRHSAGRWAEQAALEYLADRGLTCLARNHRSRFGEIDLVMGDGEVLVFVEVRFRRDDRFGGGAESVTWAKRRRLLAAAREMPETLSVAIPYDEPLSRRITAGSDMMLMPSRFEPCGLTHIYGMRYGSVPVVRETGGLRDSVRAFSPETGEGTGFRFGAYSAQTLVGALRQALELFRSRDGWRRVVANAMTADFSWTSSAVEYGDLYESALEARTA